MLLTFAGTIRIPAFRTLLMLHFFGTFVHGFYSFCLPHILCTNPADISQKTFTHSIYSFFPYFLPFVARGVLFLASRRLAVLESSWSLLHGCQRFLVLTSQELFEFILVEIG